MGQHGTVVRIDVERKRNASDMPRMGESLHLWVPAACAGPLLCVVEDVSGQTLTLRALVGTNVVFIAGSPAEVLREGVAVGVGQVK